MSPKLLLFFHSHRHRCLTPSCLARSCIHAEVHRRPWLTRCGIAGRCVAKRGELPYVKNGAKVYLFVSRQSRWATRDKISAGRGAQSQRRRTNGCVWVPNTHARKNKTLAHRMNARVRGDEGYPRLCRPVLKMCLCVVSQDDSGDVEIWLVLGARLGGVSHQDQLSSQRYSITFTSAGETVMSSRLSAPADSELELILFLLSIPSLSFFKIEDKPVTWGFDFYIINSS